jgi:hypothetical protein
MLSQSTSEMCVLTLETVEVATDPEWALVLLLASRLISTLSSLLIFLDKKQRENNGLRNPREVSKGETSKNPKPFGRTK